MKLELVQDESTSFREEECWWTGFLSYIKQYVFSCAVKLVNPVLWRRRIPWPWRSPVWTLISVCFVLGFFSLQWNMWTLILEQYSCVSPRSVTDSSGRRCLSSPASKLEDRKSHVSWTVCMWEVRMHTLKWISSAF